MSYLECLERWRIEPNFWMSGEYFEKAGFREERKGNVWYVRDDEGKLMFPPVHESVGLIAGCEDIWADVDGFQGEGQKEFLDWEYIYDPRDFLRLEGGKWRTFRKNVRRYARIHSANLLYESWNSASSKLTDLSEQVEDIVVQWLQKDESRYIWDAEVMLTYVREGQNREVLWDVKSKKVLGVNIWDENYWYVNFRYCFCCDEKYLSEYLRWCFYLARCFSGNPKLVNDGGTLGSQGLERFKDKLNPIKKRRVYSWRVSEPK